VAWSLIFDLLFLAVLVWLVLVIGGTLNRMLRALRSMRATLEDLKQALQDLNRGLRSVGYSLEDVAHRADTSLGSTERILYDIKETLRRD
jgi:hypothetical protein